MDIVSLLLLVLACLVLSAFFSGSETALLRLGSHEIEEEVRELRGPSAIAARDLLGHTSRLLVTILLGNNLVNILGAAAASAVAIAYLGESTGIVVATARGHMTIQGQQALQAEEGTFRGEQWRRTASFPIHPDGDGLVLRITEPKVIRLTN